MPETATEAIPTSAAVFRNTGGEERFAIWLRLVRSDLEHPSCAEIAVAASVGLDLFGQAAPHVIARDLPAAETFIDKADLQILGISMHRRGELKQGVRALHAWIRGLDEAGTRTLMDSGTLLAPAAQRRACPVATAPPVPEAVAAGRVEMPHSYRLFETAVASERARRLAAGESDDLRHASRTVLARQGPEVWRRLALVTAEACAVRPGALIKSGAISTPACYLFLIRLVEFRRPGGRVPCRAR